MDYVNLGSTGLQVGRDNADADLAPVQPVKVDEVLELRSKGARS